MFELILVSQSPRRKDLLAKAGYNFSLEHIKVSEIIDENLKLDEALEALARQKAEAFIATHKHLKSQKIVLLTADTVVVFQGRVLGKPKNHEQAHEYLQLLSGKMHSVKTSVCVYDLATCQSHSAVETSHVSFKKLTDSQIKTYIESGEPMDKAGAYAIQGEGRHFVEKYEGPWDNIVGLPMQLFEKLLEENGIAVNKK